MKFETFLQDFVKNPELNEGHIHEYAFVDPKDIPFGEAVRAACEANYCGRYGKCWTCPPGVGDWQELRDQARAYQRALIFTTCTELEDSYDLEGMGEAAAMHSALNDKLRAMLRELPGTFAFYGAGSCTRCEKCTYPDAPCRFPELAMRSMEACGMDVVNLSKLCKIHYINGPDTVTYFSAVLFSEAE